MEVEGFVKRKTTKKYFYRGIEVQNLVGRTRNELLPMFTSHARRKFLRGLKAQPLNLMKRIRKAKQEAAEGEKPAPVKTHLRSMVIVPEMVGSIIGVYNGQHFLGIEIKADMVGHVFAEFAISYKPVQHGKPGVGAANTSRFIPLK